MIEGEMKELTVEKDELMVVVPLKEYRKLIRKVEKLKALRLVDETQHISNGYLDRALAAEKQVRELKDNLEDAKAQIRELIGLNELKKVKDYAEQASS